MKRISIRHLSLFLVAALLALTIGSPSVTSVHAAGNVLYAQPNSIGAGDCSSWANACDLQTALATATSGDQVWARWGTYKPTTGTDRNISFQLVNGVTVYGGFLSGATQLTQRNPSAYPSILSGEIGTYVNSDNSYHVVVGSATDSSAVLDGLTITNGNGNGIAGNGGGGMYNSSGSPTLTNVTFSSNSATWGGGMVNFNNSNPTLTNVTFMGNSASNFGGGMYNSNSNPILTNVTFSENSALRAFNGAFYYDGYGGGMYNYNSNPTLTNVTFIENSGYAGGGMFNVGSTGSGSNPNLTNVTFSGNSADANGGGMYNGGSSPTLTNVTFSDNSAATGGGMANEDYPVNYSYSHPTLKNVIIANSLSGGDCVRIYGGAFNAASSNNLIEDASNACGLSDGVDGNIIGQDPMLDFLGNNGGSTLTHALLPGSPAIDTGDDASCPANDQHGETRPQGSHCDIGAYEVTQAPVDGTPPSVDSITRADANPTLAQNLDFTVAFSEPVTGVNMSDFSLTVTGNVSGASISNLSGSGDTYTVSVNRGSGDGTIRLDLNASGTGIEDLASNPIGGGYTSGESYTILPNSSASFTSLGAYDGYVLESGENTDIGFWSNVTGTNFILGDNAYRRQYRSFLHFDTSSLPDGAVITSLTLQIKKQGGTGTNPFSALGNLLVDIIQPYFGAGIGLAVSDFQAAPSTANVGFFNPTPLADNWYSAALDPSAFPFLNVSGSTQFRLAFSIDDNNNRIADTLRFFSGNYSTASYRPVLIVEYYVP